MSARTPNSGRSDCHSSQQSDPAVRNPEEAEIVASAALNSLLSPRADGPGFGRPSYLGDEANVLVKSSLLARATADKTHAEVGPCPHFGLASATRPESWAAEVCRSLQALKANHAHVINSLLADAVAVSLTGGNEDAVQTLAIVCLEIGVHALFSFGPHPAWRRLPADHRPHVHGIFMGDIEALFAHWSNLTGESVHVQHAKPFTLPGRVEGWLDYCTHNHESQLVVGAGLFAPVIANAFADCNGGTSTYDGA